jgi:hypothetical protein
MICDPLAKGRPALHPDLEQADHLVPIGYLARQALDFGVIRGCSSEHKDIERRAKALCLLNLVAEFTLR